ncbi:M15 family metallopeptidase [Falsibacillus pallidus]|uniref:M15 family metallopeptidase n=1 Tax=Falsibacillus pallidus TaxID=493781 RepID=UPI003D984C72
MKRIIMLTSAAMLLSGCSVPYLDKLTGEHSAEPQETPATQTKSDPNQNVPSQGSADGQNQNDNQEMPAGLVLNEEQFNDIKEVDGKKVIQNSSNVLALVNKEYTLPSTYIPADLVRPQVAFSFGDQDIEKSHMRAEAASHLEKMFNAAKKEGIELYAASGYRSYSRQDALLKAEIKSVGEEKAVQAVAIPGESEHQSGLAMDITSKGENMLLTEHFEQTAEGKWLREHAHEYGFILRYPKGKENITGYEYEPWHFRYVGEKAATEIYSHNWTLEEYFQHVKKV